MCQIAIYTPIGGDPKAQDALRITVTVEALIKKGVKVSLLDFNADPSRYTEDHTIQEVILRDGPDVLPVTVVDGEVYLKKEYPHYGDLLAWSAARA